MSKLPEGLHTIAQEWEDFKTERYGATNNEEKRRAIEEFRTCFYSGFLSCLSCMAVTYKSTRDAMAGYSDEITAFRNQLEDSE